MACSRAWAQRRSARSPSCVTATGELTTFARGDDGALYQDATKVAGGLAGPPDALLDRDGKIQAFARGTDGAIWRLADGKWKALTGDSRAIRWRS